MDEGKVEGAESGGLMDEGKVEGTESGGLMSMSLTGWLVTGIVVLLVLWIWKSYRSFTVFSKMGVPNPPPLPIFGNMFDFFKYGFVGSMLHYTEHYGKVCGVYGVTGPTLVIADMDMLREILVKKFQYFPNRITRAKMNYKPWKDMVSEMEGDHWKHVRSTLSPTFSAGKMKRMMPVIQRITVCLTDYLNDIAAKDEMIELKDICGRFSMDVIAGTAFGFDVSSIQQPDHEFVKHAHSIMNPSKLQVSLIMLFPNLAEFLNRHVVRGSMKSSLDFFMGVTEAALKERYADMQTHHDFLQLLVEAEMDENQGPVDAEINHSEQLTTSEKWSRKGLTKDEIEGNAFTFLVAGYETVSTVMSFTLFCLANNPEILKKAQDEVDRILGKKVANYESVSELSYVDMCISEAMRLFPPGFILSRKPTEDVEVKGLKIPKGMGVLVPVVNLHKDPDVWPEPDTYDPLRFTTEEKGKRHPFSFMPFGMGPRNCIGMRLAQLEVRMGVATVIQHFTPILCEKSVYPPKLSKIRMQANDGLWIKLQKRE